MSTTEDAPLAEDETSIDPTREPLSFALPENTERFVVQLPGLDGRTQRFELFVADGICIDGGESRHRWVIGKSLVAVKLWLSDPKRAPAYCVPFTPPQL